MVVCSCVLDGEKWIDIIIIIWWCGEKCEQLKKFILQPLQFSKKSKIKKYFLFLLYAESGIKQKFYCFLQVFFLCFYRLAPGKASIYGGMFTFTAKPPEPEIRVCVHFHSHHIHFFITPINPQLLGLTEKVPLTVQTLNYW